MRKHSKQYLSVIQKKLWKECRRIVYERDKNKDGTIDCYTCDAKNIQGSNRQLGHLWAKASLGAYLKYDLRVLRWQCARCNLFLGGQGAVFYTRLLRQNGPKAMRKLENDKRVSVKAMAHYTRILDEYRKL